MVVSLNTNDEFDNIFKSCVWTFKTPNEFKTLWKFIMVEFKL